jgi:N-acyl-L-homoserine lactone synthetase
MALTQPESILSFGDGVELGLDGGSRARLALLTAQEFAELALPLREAVYHRELGWFAKPVNRLDDVRDTYDDLSLHLGILIDDTVLAASLRVVHANALRDLPSGPFLLGRTFPERGVVCEISRAIVDRRYRHSGLFQLMLQASPHIALRLQAQHLFISGAKSPRAADILGRQGFHAVNTDFYFFDGVIRPPGLSTAYARDLSRPGDGLVAPFELRASLANALAQPSAALR